MRISRTFHYDAAHRLPNVPEGHKCGRLHGHTYVLTVTVEGPVNEISGWVMDFADLGTAVKPVLDALDHHYLNDVAGLDNPTVEVQLAWLVNRFIHVPGLCELHLREGLNNSATWSLHFIDTAVRQQT